MKIWRYVALLAIVAVPFVLMRKENPRHTGPVETDEIFDYDLTIR